LTEMGKATGWQLAKAVKALIRQDDRLAEEIIKDDAKIDALQQEIENLAIQILAKRQPLAVDLRNVIAALKISTDLERVADYAANIAKNTIGINKIAYQKPMDCIVAMGKSARRMLEDAVDALLEQDMQKAVAVWNQDDEIDAAFSRMMHYLRRYMRESPQSIDTCTRLIFIGRCCERIGDHITNVAENVYFIGTGKTNIEPTEEI